MNPIERLEVLAKELDERVITHPKTRAVYLPYAELRAIIAALRQRDEAFNRLDAHCAAVSTDLATLREEVRRVALDMGLSQLSGGFDGITSAEALRMAARLRAALEGEKGET